ncbi:MAG TPA: hypothetical protein VF179_21025 [Thermoanaerobaculia bacterium]|nr:hypothetical protein [Thermoanaerobaculia bacterium]
MKVMTGTVVNGRIEVPPEALSEGARVMIVAAEPGGLVRLTPAEEEELLAASEEIRRGEYVDGDDLVRELRSRLG